MRDNKAIKQRDNKAIKPIISICAVVLLLIRIIWPELKDRIDSISIGLLAMAILPWLSGLLESAKFGDLEVHFRQIEDKISAASDKIRDDIVKNAEGIPAAVSYELSPPSERVLYSDRSRKLDADFQGRAGRSYKKVHGLHVPMGTEGEGAIKAEEGTLKIERFNKEGRYEISLQSYDIDGVENDVIPPGPDPAHKRRLRVSCEARARGGEHTLMFVLKGQSNQKWLASDERRVSVDEWVTLNVYFLVSLTEPCRLRIDDQDVSAAPSSVEIRNVVLAERTG